MKFLSHSLSILLLTLSGFFATTAVADDECKGTAVLSIGNTSAQVELAIDERTRRYGLMFRSSMGENCGMLFVFDDIRPRVFTMRNTLIPLDIAFIDEKGRIGEIFTMQPGGDRYPSSVAALYALEMNKGWFEANGIKVSDIIEVPNGSGDPLPIDSVLLPKE